MIRLILLSILISLTSSIGADELKVFTESRRAIGAARADGKLIVFFLWDSKDKKHSRISQKLNTDLNRLNSEFVLVNLAHSMKKNRDLFTGRFGVGLESMPVAVVSNESGEAITAVSGDKEVEYDRLLLKARIDGGKITDPVKLANLRESLERVGEDRGFLTPMVEDLGRKKVAITKMRSWNKKDGTSFDAILLEALGDQGVFIDESGESTKIPFNDLSQTDIQFLQSVLTVN